MCHVLSEGSKWSGWVRPCGLSPCAPRYYYSTPRCPIVYGLVLSSVYCAPVWCCVLCLRCSCASVLWCALCLACPACGAVAVVRVCVLPCSPCPCGCVLRCALYALYVCPLFSAPYTGAYIGGHKNTPTREPLRCPM